MKNYSLFAVMPNWNPTSWTRS